MSEIAEELKASAVKSGSESEDVTIWDRAQAKRRRASYIQPSLVSKLFPGVDTKTICQLCEMVEASPLEVQELIPGATTKQVCRFFDLIEASSKAAAEVNRDKSEDLAMSDPNKSLFEQLRDMHRQRQDIYL